ncbi:MAG: hypothetical protein M1820_000502 [Bogoriella megaspora]|nr:MAG: hypothetical protein M1820_000502 [Bogoriella megaspora]
MELWLMGTWTLLDAKEDEDEWPGIFKSISGLVFFGTLFRGAEGLEQGLLLESSDERLALRVTSLQQFVVNESSGCLDILEAIEKYLLERTYFNMNKFGNPKEEDFQTVCEVIGKMAKEVLKIALARLTKQSQTPSFYLHFPPNSRLVGRSSELDTLKQKLLVDKDCQKIALVGLGGISKTQIALRFVHAVRQDYPEYSIFWVPALSMEIFKQAYKGIARVLGLNQQSGSDEDVKKLVQHRLSAGVVKWLLIVDNADKIKLLYRAGQAEGLLDFLPQSKDSLTVFTTRHFKVAQSVASSNIVEVGKMEIQEATTLLEKSLVRKTHP